VCRLGEASAWASGDACVMEIIKGANLLLRFLLELCAVG
jgi:hypothetical protein